MPGFGLRSCVLTFVVRKQLCAFGCPDEYPKRKWLTKGPVHNTMSPDDYVCDLATLPGASNTDLSTTLKSIDHMCLALAQQTSALELSPFCSLHIQYQYYHCALYHGITHAILWTSWCYGLHDTRDLVLSLLSLWFLLYQETIPLTNTLLRNQG